MKNYTKLKNTFLDNLHQFTGTQIKILLVVTRHTIGENRYNADIRDIEFVKYANVKQSTLKTNINLLSNQFTLKKNQFTLEKSSLLVFDPKATNPLALENSYTPVNNTFFTNLHQYETQQIKVLLCILRNSVGSNQTSANITLAKLKHLTGIQHMALLSAIEKLESNGKIKVDDNKYQILDKDILISCCCHKKKQPKKEEVPEAKQVDLKFDEPKKKQGIFSNPLWSKKAK